MGGTVTLKDLGLDNMDAVERKRLEHENEILKTQIARLHKFISEKWFITLDTVQEHVDNYLTLGEQESIKVIQGRIENHDWIMIELNRFETSMMDEYKRLEELLRYGRNGKRKEKAEAVVK